MIAAVPPAPRRPTLPTTRSAPHTHRPSGRRVSRPWQRPLPSPLPSRLHTHPLTWSRTPFAAGHCTLPSNVNVPELLSSEGKTRLVDTQVMTRRLPQGSPPCAPPAGWAVRGCAHPSRGPESQACLSPLPPPAGHSSCPLGLQDASLVATVTALSSVRMLALIATPSSLKAAVTRGGVPRSAL